MHPGGETMTKSFGEEKNVNVPVDSSIRAIRPVERKNIPDINSEPPAGGHMKVWSMTTGLDSLSHFFTSKSTSPSEEGMAVLMEFVLLQERESGTSIAPEG